MNKLLFSLFVIFSAALAQSSCQYTKLSSRAVERSTVIKDLRELGADWVLSRAMFHNSKLSLDHKQYGIAKTLSVGRRISNGVYYFKYNVLMIRGDSENDFPAEPDPQYDIIINATYIISFRPKNGKVSVTSYRYSVKFPEMQPEVGSDMPFYMDPTLENGPSVDDVDYVVEHAIKDGSIRDGKYSLGKVYNIFKAEDHVEEYYLVTLVRTDGYTYRAQIVKTDDGTGDYGYNYDYKIYTNRL